MTPPLPRLCLCGHPLDLHAPDGAKRCRKLLCGCDIYRAAPSVSAGAEAYLAGREGSQDAGNEGAVALWPGRSLARVLAGVLLRPTLPRQLKGPDLLA